jgi:rfaE bifunctional protein nucleotidyltransferase chain/domain
LNCVANHLIIEGQFQFLHTINTAWLVKLRKCASKQNQRLVIRLQPGCVYPFSELSEFLTSFQLADAIEPMKKSSPYRDVPVDIPKPDEARRIIKSWAEPLINSCIFGNLQSFLPVLSSMRQRQASIVTTNGCFDILHPGHVNTLRTGKKIGDVLIVLINSDESISRFKGDSRPIHNWLFRARLLIQLSCVDYVVVFDHDTPLEHLKTIQPNHHFKGGSFIEDRLTAERELLSRWGGVLHTLPMTNTYSTTKLLQKFNEPPFPV